jgi:hypothetical protein
VAERAVEAELRQALAAAAKLKVAAAEADAAASNVADKVRRGEVQPGDIQREVKKEVARGNVQRRVGGGGVGRAGDVARETRDVEKLTKAEREEARESARAAREKQLARQGGAAQRLQAYETRIGEKEARGDFQGIQSMYRKAERLRGELQQEVRAADQAQARAASRRGAHPHPGQRPVVRSRRRSRRWDRWPAPAPTAPTAAASPGSADRRRR